MNRKQLSDKLDNLIQFDMPDWSTYTRGQAAERKMGSLSKFLIRNKILKSPVKNPSELVSPALAALRK